MTANVVYGPDWCVERRVEGGQFFRGDVMKVIHIKDNSYQVDLSKFEQAKVELAAEQSNISNCDALDCIISDGFIEYGSSTQ